jgi:hypothetical protein
MCFQCALAAEAAGSLMPSELIAHCQMSIALLSVICESASSVPADNATYANYCSVDFRNGKICLSILGTWPGMHCMLLMRHIFVIYNTVISRCGTVIVVHTCI